MAKLRTEVSKDDSWDLDSLYPTFDSWEAHYKIAKGHDASPHWPEIQKFRGKLGEGPSVLKEAMDTVFKIDRELSKLYVYAHLRHDEEITHDGHKSSFGRILGTIHDFANETSWFDPELLALSDETMKSYLESPLLSDYRFHLEKTIRAKKHMLSADGEALLSLAGKALQTPNKAFSALNDADFKFGSVQDQEGKSHELTHGSYSAFLQNKDRTLRKNAFLTLHGKYLQFENTMCELLNGTVQSHLFNAKARNFTTCLEASLFPNNIDTSAYHALITAVHNKLDSLHRYIKLRTQLLDIGPLHPYDMFVPLIPSVDIRMSYKEAEEVVIESVAPLGSDYQNLLKKGLKTDRWVDRYENQNKRSGAYSSGCYDSHPYILMNYKNILRDVFTLAHEAGHSMHTLLSQTNQPYHYANYPIFVAEVASTFNEELLMRQLIARAKTPEEKAYLINQKLDDIRSTLFRQAMFAEFELWIHTQAEQSIPLTPKSLREEYRRLNALYFGETVVLDPECDSEWSRIPHFYYNFYVYQYSTGISAALSLADRVVHGGQSERDAYLKFLMSGSSKYPLDLLKEAGVDMRSPVPVEAAIDRFSSLVDDLETLAVGSSKPS